MTPPGTRSSGPGDATRPLYRTDGWERPRPMTRPTGGGMFSCLVNCRASSIAELGRQLNIRLPRRLGKLAALENTGALP